MALVARSFHIERHSGLLDFVQNIRQRGDGMREKVDEEQCAEAVHAASPIVARISHLPELNGMNRRHGYDANPGHDGDGTIDGPGEIVWPN